MKNRFAVAAVAAVIAGTTLATPAMADEKIDFLPGQTLSPEAEAFHHNRHETEKKADENKKPSIEEQSAQADLTAKRLENAKKGVETSKQIVDTLGGLGKIFGFGAPADDKAEA